MRLQLFLASAILVALFIPPSGSHPRRPAHPFALDLLARNAAIVPVAADDEFAYSVSVDGDTALLGAPRDDLPPRDDAGSAYVFVRSGTDWTLQGTLVSPTPASRDYFGRWVSLDGDTAVVGAPSDDTPAGANAGSAWVFVRSGTTWSLQAELPSPSPAAMDFFGRSVSVDGDTAVVTAPFHDGPAGADTGAAGVYVRSGTTWSLQDTVTAPNPAPDDRFGKAVSVDGDTVVVGMPREDAPGAANSGAAFVFVRVGTDWVGQAKLTVPDPRSSDAFGRWLALDGDTAVVGAPSDDTPAGSDAGSAHVFLRSGTTWSRQATLSPATPAAGDHFGFRADVNAETAVVASPMDDTSAGSDAGTVSVFVRSGSTWTLEATLTSPDPAALDRFGRSVGVHGDTAVVGVPYDDTQAGFDEGSAWVFVRTGTVWAMQAHLTPPGSPA